MAMFNLPKRAAEGITGTEARGALPGEMFVNEISH